MSKISPVQFFVVVCLLLFATTGAASGGGMAPKRFFFDPEFVVAKTNVAVALGVVRKDPANPLFGEEYPWEPRYDNMYPNVIWDAEDEIYKCWYTPFVVWDTDESQSVRPDKVRWHYRASGLCYATSRDGIRWEKPLFPEFLFEGRPSNVLMRNVHGAGVFKDVHEADPQRRYKMVMHYERPGLDHGMSVSFSADGIHWAEPQSLPHVKLKADTHNNAFWDPNEQQYVAITRDWEKIANVGLRLVSRMTSPDFVSWSEPEEILRGSKPTLQTYAMPVFPFEGIYLGLPVIFDTVSDRVHVELAWSRNGKDWQRLDPGNPLIPLGEQRGVYDYGCIFPAVAPVITTEGINLYYGASDGKHIGFRRGYLALARLRPDGFAGLKNTASSQAAEVTTIPLRCENTAEFAFRLTTDIGSRGTLQAIAIDPISQQELGRSELFTGERNWTSHLIEIPLAAGVASDRVVSLRLVFTDGILYSLQIPDR